MRRDRLDIEWQVYSVFKDDLTGQVDSDEHPNPGLCLVTRLGKGKLNSTNFLWMTKAEAAARIHARAVEDGGRLYSSLTEGARAFSVPASTLRYLIKKNNCNAEQAIYAYLHGKARNNE